MFASDGQKTVEFQCGRTENSGSGQKTVAALLNVRDNSVVLFPIIYYCCFSGGPK